jgi:uncharacterized protein YndB with AHSA1/START domain
MNDQNLWVLKFFKFITMEKSEKTTITVRTTVPAPVEHVWELWTDPKHITRWNFASDDWHCPAASNDLRPGGRFVFRMEAMDGESGFDFSGTYTKVDYRSQIGYTIDDGRQVQIMFIPRGKLTNVFESFEAESQNSLELQQSGWQAILNNFKKYVAASLRSDPMHFEIEINSGAEKVYHVMLDEDSYPKWTAIFNPSSHFTGSWDKGSKILFLGTDNNGGTGGMVSRIKENIPNKFVSIEHMGVVENGKEIFCGPNVDQWAGALENYTFNENQGKTSLKIDIDVAEGFKSYFEKMWPLALNRLKEICEKTA